MILAAAMAMGIGAGLVYFGGLWLTLQRMLHAPQGRHWLAISHIGRLSVCGMMFCVVSLAGLGAILSALSGFWIARVHLLRRLGRTIDGR